MHRAITLFKCFEAGCQKQKQGLTRQTNTKIRSVLQGTKRIGAQLIWYWFSTTENTAGSSHYLWSIMTWVTDTLYTFLTELTSQGIKDKREALRSQSVPKHRVSFRSQWNGTLFLVHLMRTVQIVKSVMKWWRQQVGAWPKPASDESIAPLQSWTGGRIESRRLPTTKLW